MTVNRFNAVNTVGDGIYHLGFETHRLNRLLNEDGNPNATFVNVGTWLNKLLTNDLQGQGADLKNSDVHETQGTTCTGLDKIVQIVYADKGLGRFVSTGNIRHATSNADQMNNIILEAANSINAMDDKVVTTQEVIAISDYIQANYKSDWIELHGDDSVAKYETGYHLVQNDGATTPLYGFNAVNTIFDGVFHLGFGYNLAKTRLYNEDHTLNATTANVGRWLTKLLNDTSPYCQ